jgi:DTW domain-containing protein
MSREYCLRCRRPKVACLCPALPPMNTRTRIVLLMHPKEYRRQKTGTGRMACLHLENSEILHGVGFDAQPRVRELLDDQEDFPALLYPGPGALDLSGPIGPEGKSEAARLAEKIGARRLVVFLIDSTWACSHSVLRASPGIAGLPRIQFRSREPSRWIIKRQPREFCLSTIEAIHELLCALESAGLDSYPDKARLLDAFAAMQRYQIERTEADRRPRRKGMESPASRDIPLPDQQAAAHSHLL